MKYYKEIENGIYLPINRERKIIHPLEDLILPEWFYEKHQILIDFIPQIKSILDNFSFNKYCIDPKNKKRFHALLENYKKLSLTTLSNLNEIHHVLEMKKSIQLWGNILDFMFSLDNTLMNNNYFIYIMQLFNQALLDIGSIDDSLSKRFLPKNWLLTANGYLYNMQSTKHEAGDFNNYFNDRINWFLDKDKTFAQIDEENSGKIKILPEFDNLSTILKNGYIHEIILELFLHYIDYFKFNGKVYDPNIVATTVGMMELCDNLMNFLRKLEIETNYPKENIRKIIRIINNKYLDFLIRCCGVSKISLLPNKTIITSRLTAKDDFKEYLDNGYDVCFIPPIIINHETRSVEELNMNSQIISKYIENEILYEDKFTKGKVYTNHLEHKLKANF